MAMESIGSERTMKEKPPSNLAAVVNIGIEKEIIETKVTYTHNNITVIHQQLDNFVEEE